MHPVEIFLARATHVSLYVLLFAMPLSAWLMSSAKNYSVSWFSAFSWPNLIEPNEGVFHFFKTLHHQLSNLLFAIASLHMLAALKHHFWNKEIMMKRRSLGAAALCAMAWLNASAANSNYSAATGASKLEFTGTQAGAEFNGTFHEYTASVEFNPDALDRAHIDVQIKLASVDTKDKDRDKTIRGPDIFDTEHFPIAHYVTRSIAKSGSGYTALGTLTLRGITRDVAITFQFLRSNESAKLAGTAQLKRLDFGAGQGDWKSTEWIADPVRISFALVLTAKQ